MQLIRRYLLNNRIVLTANLAGQVTRYRSVYQRNINVYRNIDNVLQFEVKNADEKAVSILNTYTPKFKIWDENDTLVAEKDGTIIETSTPSKVGQFTITLTENDLLNLKQQYMSYSVYLYHTNDAKNVLTYPNSHFGSQGTIYLNTSNFPGPKVSHEVKTFIEDTQDNTIYNSETITADPAINGNIALHTAAYYTTDAVGTLTVQGTLDAQIGAGTNWADVATTNLTASDTLQYVNFNGVYQHLRFRHQITAGTIDKILVRN
mgnify:CR=1 FL=1